MTSPPGSCAPRGVGGGKEGGALRIMLCPRIQVRRMAHLGDGGAGLNLQLEGVKAVRLGRHGFLPVQAPLLLLNPGLDCQSNLRRAAPLMMLPTAFPRSS